MLRILEKHQSALTADFPRFYNQRLLTAVEELPVGEVLDMIQWLPPGCAFRASLEAEGDLQKAFKLYGWGSQEELLLNLINRVNENTWVLAQANSKKTVRKPTPAYGPRGKPKNKGQGDASAMARSLLNAQG